MQRARRLVRQALARPRVLLWLAAAAALVAALVGLRGWAAAETDALKSPEVRAFERTPQDWLAHERGAGELLRATAAGEIASAALVQGRPGLVLYTLKDGTRASTTVPGCGAQGCVGNVLDGIVRRSAETGFALVAVDVDPRTPSRRAVDLVDALVPTLLMLGAVVGVLLGAGRLQARLDGGAAQLAERPATRLADVIGQAEAKAALQRVTAFMQDPSRYAKLGATPPRGVLLVGPPGTGKTLLAKALAGETKATFIPVDGSYFSAKFYGAGVAKVRELFRTARRGAPCVLFIDEIDGIGRRHTGGAASGGESELNRIINRVLVEMDGFEALDNVVVVAATNHEDNIDEAMRRPGRFDMLVRLSLPTLPERQALFDFYLARVTHDGSADTGVLARMSAGLSPADIANLVNKAASTAAEQGAAQVGHEHLLRAIETQQLGGEVSPVKGLLSDSTRRRLAYHEAGHALVGHGLRVGSVERVTIEPRGAALGVTYIHRETEEPLYGEAELGSRLAMMLAGREAELMVLGSVSSGAADDLKRASELAIRMVGTMGFSKVFGLLSVDGVPQQLLGPDVQAGLLDEARVALERAQSACRALLLARRGQLDALAQRLLEREALSGDELAALLDDTALPLLEAA